MAVNALTKGEGALFIQRTPVEGYSLVTCAGVGDITFPHGDITIRHLPAPEYGRWRRADILRGEGGAITLTLERPLRSVADYLLRLGCEANFAVNFACAGPRQNYSNFMHRIYLFSGIPTQHRISAPVSIEPSTDYVTFSVDISALEYLFYSTPASSPISSATGVTSVVAVPAQCASRCARRIGAGERVYMADGTTTIRYTLDYGVNWNSATAPFAVQSLLLLPDADRETIVAGSVASVSSPAMVAVSEDRGASWTAVELDTAFNVAVSDFAVEESGILYCVAGNGIFRSVTRGVSWARAVTATSTFNAVDIRGGVGYAVGAAGQAYRLVGTSWLPVSTGITVDLVGVSVNRAGYAYAIAGDTDGTIYRFYESEVDAVTTIGMILSGIAFDAMGYLCLVSGASGLVISEDGGVTWRSLSTTAGTGVFPFTDAGWFVPTSTGVSRWAVPEE